MSYLAYLAFEITEAQLLISGLASGIAVVGVVVKWLVSSPVREAEAYQKGLLAEQNRCQEDIDELRQARTTDREEFQKARDEYRDEITKLRNALLKLALAADLTQPQRVEIAKSLGYSEVITQIIVDPKTVEGGHEPD